MGEGIGAVLLRPLADALRDGDPVLAILRGSAVNTCGRTTSYSAPSVTAQTAVIEAAMRRAGVDPGSISYVEAHGTGTELGDPVEVRALTQAWRNASDQGDAPRMSCAIGSIKPNIGHLEAAAGIAGLTKVLLQLRHGMLAPSLHAVPPNPNIDFAVTPFAVQTRLAPWPRLAGPRRAGLSSFGLGGANAHVVLEEAPALPPAAPDDGSPVLILVSARTEDRLRAHLQRLAAALRAEPGLAVRDVAWTLQVGRQGLAERWAVVVHSQAELLAAIEAWLAGQAVPGLQRGSLKRLGSSAAAGTVAEPGQATDPFAMAVHWAQGGRILPERLPRAVPPRIVALPNYPFEPRRFWLDEGPAFLAPQSPPHGPRRVPHRRRPWRRCNRWPIITTSRCRCAPTGSTKPISRWPRWSRRRPVSPGPARCWTRPPTQPRRRPCWRPSGTCAACCWTASTSHHARCGCWISAAAPAPT
ncbi:ketoacyl-synthetase C-terminal extension domain-containing protein [Siccirubricoccus deserti]